MKLERKLRHKSEDTEEMCSWTRCKRSVGASQVVSREYDVPNIAGYRADGHTVFIDRRLPKCFRWLLR